MAVEQIGGDVQSLVSAVGTRNLKTFEGNGLHRIQKIQQLVIVHLRVLEGYAAATTGDDPARHGPETHEQSRTNTRVIPYRRYLMEPCDALLTSFVTDFSISGQMNICEYCRKPNPVNQENGIMIKYKMDGKELQAALHKYCASEWCKRLPHVIAIEIAPVE
jgi:hypothetical protein